MLNNKSYKNKKISEPKTSTNKIINTNNHLTKPNNDLYNLFSNRKYKTLYERCTSNPKLLNEIINDDKTIVQYAIQINNKKLVKKLIKLDKQLLVSKSRDGYYLPYYALINGLNDMFFYLIDTTIKADEKILFNVGVGEKTITHSVIEKKNFPLFNSYFEKYFKHINWLSIIDNTSYLYLIINAFNDNFDKIMPIIEQIVKQVKESNNSDKIADLFKYPQSDNALFYLIYCHYRPDIIVRPNNTQSIQKFSTNIELLKKFIKLFPEQLDYINQINRTPIYYMAEANDINMLDFCLQNGANPNHTSPLGYINFAHNVMKWSNKETINYVLTTNHKINFNHIDQNNETPIFNLLRNQLANSLSNTQTSNENNLTISNIINLLKKTNDWNLQNIYGQTIIHMLVTRSDIENFYPILKTKYFDINAKNKVGTTPLQLLYANLKKNNSNLTENQLQDKLNEFKELVVDSYIDSIINSDTDIDKDIVANTKIQCKLYSSTNPDKKKTVCWTSVIDLLSKPLYTDLDKLSSSYKNIIFDDYSFSHYNLYNARDSDIYLYYIILMSKYELLGVPQNSNKFDQKLSITNTFQEKFNDSTIDDNVLNHIFYLKTVVSNTIKHYMLYPLNIYWINENNYLIPYDFANNVLKTIDTGYKFIICRVNIINKILHANILLIDTINMRIIRFEPQGGVNNTSVNTLDEKIEQSLKKNEFFSSYIFIRPVDYEPLSGFQSLSQETNTDITRKGDINGFCVAWCLWFIELYIKNHVSLSSVSSLKSFFSKTIKKLINTNYLISDYIRNYANYMHDKLIQLLTKNGFPLTNLYYERYTDDELDQIYSFINSKIKNF
jgi:hypothetical protein